MLGCEFKEKINKQAKKKEKLKIRIMKILFLSGSEKLEKSIFSSS
jgi:hypothetical protein